jgi:leucyl-tRNA synthetase
MIDKITKGLERFHYNGIIANLYETYNFFNKEIEKPLDGKSLIKNYNKILYLLMPIIPHFSSECLQNIGNNEKSSWPKANEDLLSEENLEIVIQINGKKKTTINCIENISEEQLINKITELNIKKNIFQGKEIKRSIFVKNRLINLILK